MSCNSAYSPCKERAKAQKEPPRISRTHLMVDFISKAHPKGSLHVRIPCRYVGCNQAAEALIDPMMSVAVICQRLWRLAAPLRNSFAALSGTGELPSHLT